MAAIDCTRVDPSRARTSPRASGGEHSCHPQRPHAARRDVSAMRAAMLRPFMVAKRPRKGLPELRIDQRLLCVGCIKACAELVPLPNMLADVLGVLADQPDREHPK